MKIHVTQEDIDNGKQNDCFYCPIARAIFRQTGFVRVDVDEVWINEETVLPLPSEARSFISKFDNSYTPSEAVEPFEFEMDL